jgi:hypothetical protein
MKNKARAVLLLQVGHDLDMRRIAKLIDWNDR